MIREESMKLASHISEVVRNGLLNHIKLSSGERYEIVVGFYVQDNFATVEIYDLRVHRKARRK